MADSAEFVIGAEVRCSGGAVCGKVERLVVDPAAATVTHLVVRVKHHHILDRLVPVGLVEAGVGGGGVRLSCSAEDLAKLDAAEEKHVLPASGSLGSSSFGYFALRGGVVTPVMGREVITDETVPFREVDVHRGDSVRANDGEIGHVEGLVIDPSDRHLTHVLLQLGHVGHRKHVAIPIETVTRIAGGVEVKLTKQQVHNLPSLEIDHLSEHG